MKSTPVRGVKENLKPWTYKQSEEPFGVLTACLLKNEPTSYWYVARLSRVTEPQRKRV